MNKIFKNRFLLFFGAFLLFLSFFLFNTGRVLANNSQLEELRLILLGYRNNISQNYYPSVGLNQRCGTAQISWQKVSGATEYKLFRNGSLVYQGKNTEFKDTGLITGLTYIYTTSAGNKGGFGQESNPQFVTVPSVCPPQFSPILSATSGLCGGEIILSWNYVPGAERYELYRGKAKIYDGYEFSFRDSVRAKSNQTYTIKAVNVGGESEMSGQVKATSSDVCPPSAPEWIGQSNTGNNWGIASLSATKYGLQTFREGARNTNVLTFKVKALEGDVIVERVSYTFTERPWLYFDKLVILDGSKVIKEIEAKEENFSRISRDEYVLSFNSLNIKVLEDKTKNINLRINVKDRVSGTVNMKIYIDRNAVRTKDLDNVISFGPVNGGEGSVFSREIRINQAN